MLDPNLAMHVPEVVEVEIKSKGYEEGAMPIPTFPVSVLAPETMSVPVVDSVVPDTFPVAVRGPQAIVLVPKDVFSPMVNPLPLLLIDGDNSKLMEAVPLQSMAYDGEWALPNAMLPVNCHCSVLLTPFPALPMTGTLMEFEKVHTSAEATPLELLLMEGVMMPLEKVVVPLTTRAPVPLKRASSVVPA